MSSAALVSSIDSSPEHMSYPRGEVVTAPMPIPAPVYQPNGMIANHGYAEPWLYAPFAPVPGQQNVHRKHGVNQVGVNAPQSPHQQMVVPQYSREVIAAAAYTLMNDPWLMQQYANGFVAAGPYQIPQQWHQQGWYAVQGIPQRGAQYASYRQPQAVSPLAHAPVPLSSTPPPTQLHPGSPRSPKSPARHHPRRGPPPPAPTSDVDQLATEVESWGLRRRSQSPVTAATAAVLWPNADAPSSAPASASDAASDKSAATTPTPTLVSAGTSTELDRAEVVSRSSPAPPPLGSDASTDASDASMSTAAESDQAPPSPVDSTPPSPRADRRSRRAAGERTRLSVEEELAKQSLYKTELCRSWTDFGACRYGERCQFAHGKHELRAVLRHPKYKTEVCKTFSSTGACPYGQRCRFLHLPLPYHLSGYSTPEYAFDSPAQLSPETSYAQLPYATQLAVPYGAVPLYHQQPPPPQQQAAPAASVPPPPEEPRPAHEGPVDTLSSS